MMLPRMFRLHPTGTFTGEVIRIISNIRRKPGQTVVNLDDCGRFVLADNLSDIADITHIDLSSISSLEGKSITTIRTFLHPSFTDQSADDDTANVPNVSQVTFRFWQIASRCRCFLHLAPNFRVRSFPQSSFADQSANDASANVPNVSQVTFLFWPIARS